MQTCEQVMSSAVNKFDYKFKFVALIMDADYVGLPDLGIIEANAIYTLILWELVCVLCM